MAQQIIKSLFTTGSNNVGQLGISSPISAINKPVNCIYRDLDIRLLTTDISQVACGQYHTAVLLKNGRVITAGYNNYGQLGIGFEKNIPSEERQNFLGYVYGIGRGSGVIQVACGDYHTAILFKDGTVKTFGYNEFGQLGNGTGIYIHRTPVDVTNIGSNSGAIQVACGGVHTAVLFEDGTVKTFGDNRHGQLGNGTTTESRIPINVTNIGSNSGAIQVACGGGHTAVLFENGVVITFGWNKYGQLGYDPVPFTIIKNGVPIPPRNEFPPFEKTPVKVIDINPGSGAIQVACGGVHTAVLFKNGIVKTFGWNKYGQLGIRTIPLIIETPSESTLLNRDAFLRPEIVSVNQTERPVTDVIQVACGENHTALLFRDGSFKTFGRNNHGQLGIGNYKNKSIPTTVLGFNKNAKGRQVACGGSHTAFIDEYIPNNISKFYITTDKAGNKVDVIRYKVVRDKEFNSPFKIFIVDKTVNSNNNTPLYQKEFELNQSTFEDTVENVTSLSNPNNRFSIVITDIGGSYGTLNITGPTNTFTDGMLEYTIKKNNPAVFNIPLPASTINSINMFLTSSSGSDTTKYVIGSSLTWVNKFPNIKNQSIDVNSKFSDNFIKVDDNIGSTVRRLDNLNVLPAIQNSQDIKLNNSTFTFRVDTTYKDNKTYSGSSSNFKFPESMLSSFSNPSQITYDAVTRSYIIKDITFTYNKEYFNNNRIDINGFPDENFLIHVFGREISNFDDSAYEVVNDNEIKFTEISIPNIDQLSTSYGELSYSLKTSNDGRILNDESRPLNKNVFVPIIQHITSEQSEHSVDNTTFTIIFKDIVEPSSGNTIKINTIFKDLSNNNQVEFNDELPQNTSTHIYEISCDISNEDLSGINDFTIELTDNTNDISGTLIQKYSNVEQPTIVNIEQITLTTFRFTINIELLDDISSSELIINQYNDDEKPETVSIDKLTQLTVIPFEEWTIDEDNSFNVEFEFTPEQKLQTDTRYFFNCIIRIDDRSTQTSNISYIDIPKLLEDPSFNTQIDITNDGISQLDILNIDTKSTNQEFDISQNNLIYTLQYSYKETPSDVYNIQTIGKEDTNIVDISLIRDNDISMTLKVEHNSLVEIEETQRDISYLIKLLPVTNLSARQDVDDIGNVNILWKHKGIVDMDDVSFLVQCISGTSLEEEEVLLEKYIPVTTNEPLYNKSISTTYTTTISFDELKIIENFENFKIRVTPINKDLEGISGQTEIISELFPQKPTAYYFYYNSPAYLFHIPETLINDISRIEIETSQSGSEPYTFNYVSLIDFIDLSNRIFLNNNFFVDYNPPSDASLNAFILFSNYGFNSLDDDLENSAFVIDISESLHIKSRFLLVDGNYTPYSKIFTLEPPEENIPEPLYVEFKLSHLYNPTNPDDISKINIFINETNTSPPRNANTGEILDYFFPREISDISYRNLINIECKFFNSLSEEVEFLIREGDVDICFNFDSRNITFINEEDISYGIEKDVSNLEIDNPTIRSLPPFIDIPELSFNPYTTSKEYYIMKNIYFFQDTSSVEVRSINNILNIENKPDFDSSINSDLTPPPLDKDNIYTVCNGEGIIHIYLTEYETYSIPIDAITINVFDISNETDICNLRIEDLTFEPGVNVFTTDVNYDNEIVEDEIIVTLSAETYGNYSESVELSLNIIEDTPKIIRINVPDFSLNPTKDPRSIDIDISDVSLNNNPIIELYQYNSPEESVTPPFDLWKTFYLNIEDKGPTYERDNYELVEGESSVVRINTYRTNVNDLFTPDPSLGLTENRYYYFKVQVKYGEYETTADTSSCFVDKLLPETCFNIRFLGSDWSLYDRGRLNPESQIGLNEIIFDLSNTEYSTGFEYDISNSYELKEKNVDITYNSIEYDKENISSRTSVLLNYIDDIFVNIKARNRYYNINTENETDVSLNTPIVPYISEHFSVNLGQYYISWVDPLIQHNPSLVTDLDYYTLYRYISPEYLHPEDISLSKFKVLQTNIPNRRINKYLDLIRLGRNYGEYYIYYYLTASYNPTSEPTYPILYALNNPCVCPGPVIGTRLNTSYTHRQYSTRSINIKRIRNFFNMR